MPETAVEEQTLNARLAPVRTARIVGLGHKLPDHVVPNGPIAERIGVDSEWIVRRTGIRERRYAAPDERTTDLALAAARRALSDAGLKATDIDLVLVATMTPDELTPNTAPLVADALGLNVARLRRRLGLHRLALRAVGRRGPDRDRAAPSTCS